MAKNFLGIFVNPVYVQYEGLNEVFDNLQMAGATAISTNMNLGQVSADGKGKRFPDLHVDGHERLLGRELWGQYELRLDFSQAHIPDATKYEALKYRPENPARLPDVDYDIPIKILHEARRRGLEAHLQFHLLTPPNLQAEDLPVYIDGTPPAPPQVATTGCPNNPDIQAYALALLEDTLCAVDGVDGVFIDWTEFGAYSLKDIFLCTCPHCQKQAIEWGYDWSQIQADISCLWRTLHQLDPTHLQIAQQISANPWALLELITAYPGWLDFLKFKARSITHFYRLVRNRLDQLALKETRLSARGWPPPWNRISGMDYRALAEFCSAVTPKLFLFDYSALPRWYGQTLLEWNPGLSEQAVLDTLVALMRLPDQIQHRSFAHYHIPAPDEPHPARLTQYRERLDEVCWQVNGNVNVYPFAHAYLPEAQWKRMIAIVRDSPADGMWVQMYGYLTDRKLEILRDMWS